MIISKTPYRISFLGGGTDFPSWYNYNEGNIISTSINKYSYIVLRFLPNLFNYKYRLRYFKTEQVKHVNKIEHNTFREAIRYLYNKKNILEIVHNSDIPTLSGLAGSSSTSVGIVNCLLKINGKNSKKNILNKTLFLEQKILNQNDGSQDQTACVYGGFNHILFRKKKIKVKKIKIKKNIKLIEKSLLLIYTQKRNSSKYLKNNKIIKIKDKSTIEKLEEINAITKEGLNLIEGKFDIKNFGKLINQYWKIKKSLNESVTNLNIDNIYEICMNMGAYGGKLLGAGGGGFIMILANSNVKKKIKEKFKESVLEVKFDNQGTKIYKI